MIKRSRLEAEYFRWSKVNGDYTAHLNKNGIMVKGSIEIWMGCTHCFNQYVMVHVWSDKLNTDLISVCQACGQKLKKIKQKEREEKSKALCV